MTTMNRGMAETGTILVLLAYSKLGERGVAFDVGQ